MKLNDFKNMKHTDGYCPICKNQSEILYDEFHGETFCCKCGYVLSNPARYSVVKLIEKAVKKGRWQTSKQKKQ